MSIRGSPGFSCLETYPFHCNDGSEWLRFSGWGGQEREGEKRTDDLQGLVRAFIGRRGEKK